MGLFEIWHYRRQKDRIEELEAYLEDLRKRTPHKWLREEIATLLHSDDQS